jgi:hypothetical protein
MSNSLSINNLRKYTSSYIIDILAIICVYFVPTLSHLTGVPFYLFEPMRLFIILALLHSNKQNAYILALTLPLFSFAIASHPYFLKALIMSVELVLNVFLYHWFVQKKMATYLSVLISITASKLIYYLLKFSLIQLMFIDSDMVSTPIFIQVITTLMFGVYGLLITMKQMSEPKK